MGIMVMRIMIILMVDKDRPGRRMVRDAALRAAPHHEADFAHAAKGASVPDQPLILRSPPQADVSKNAGALAPLPPDPSPQGGGETSATDLSAGALYRLMAWLSPSYPVGAFSYSGGVEWAVEAGDITDRQTLERWLAVVIGQGGGFCDAVFFVHAHRAVAARDDLSLREVAELAAAFAPSKERHLETTAQGAAFVQATQAAWNCAALDTLASVWDGPVAYPVAVGVASAGHGIALQAALGAYLHAVTANLISAGVRLIPLGQTDGQRALAALEKVAAATAARAMVTKLEDVGGAALRADLASMHHETQYTRLFRS
jgi:urease accessory protein